MTCLRVLMLLFVIYRVCSKSTERFNLMLSIDQLHWGTDTICCCLQWPQNTGSVNKTHKWRVQYIWHTSIEASAAFFHVPYSYSQPTGIVQSLVMYCARTEKNNGCEEIRFTACMLSLLVGWLGCRLQTLYGENAGVCDGSKSFSVTQSCCQTRPIELSHNAEILVEI